MTELSPPTKAVLDVVNTQSNSHDCIVAALRALADYKTTPWDPETCVSDQWRPDAYMRLALRTIATEIETSTTPRATR
jgi:hypothetical protein